MTPSTLNWILLAIALWTIPWKVYAVWTAAKRREKKWFVAMLILNTVALLEIFYIFMIAKKSVAEVKRDFKNAISSFK